MNDLDAYLQTPIARLSRSLFVEVAHGPNFQPTPSANIADVIEQSVVLMRESPSHWTEASIGQQFGVGRRIARQASRILQFRCVMTARRGGNKQGGLAPIKLDIQHVSHATFADISGAFDVTAQSHARDGLSRHLHNAHPAVTELIAALFAEDSEPRWRNSDNDRDGACDGLSQAERIAMKIVQEGNDGRTGLDFLGSLEAISARFRVSLDVAVESVRLLQAVQMARLKKGRGGGVLLEKSKPIRALHIINGFLAQQGVPDSACRNVQDAANIAMIELACARRNIADLGPVHGAFAAIKDARTPDMMGRRWINFMGVLADLANNPLLHLIAQSFASSIVMQHLTKDRLTDDDARALWDASQRLFEALLAGNVSECTMAHARCQSVFHTAH